MLLNSLLDTKLRHRVLKDKYIIDYISVQGKDCISEAFGGSLVTPAFFAKLSIFSQHYIMCGLCSKSWTIPERLPRQMWFLGLEG